MKIEEAKVAIDKVINKGRVHLYKPIQIAEILYRFRVYCDFDIGHLDSFRTKSRKWRDQICLQFLGRTSTSSARYQDDLFNENAVPLNAIVALAEYNSRSNGVVEAYIYTKFAERFNQMTSALDYVRNKGYADFQLPNFLELFWLEPGLRRSIDKVFEIIVYSLFSVLVEELSVTIEVSYDESKKEILTEFEDFTKKVICIDSTQSRYVSLARIHRVGVTNAADRGLDMWANFGPAIQIKHLQLDEKLAKSITGSVSAERIVIVCKEKDKQMAQVILNQLGWATRIQSIITEDDLNCWYERALRGKFSSIIGPKIKSTLENEILLEFPTTDKSEFENFFKSRGYYQVSKDTIWDPKTGPNMEITGEEVDFSE